MEQAEADQRHADVALNEIELLRPGENTMKETVNVKASPSAAKKPPAKAKNSKKGRLSAEGRKKLSLAAKKRWAIAKRKGISAVTGRPLSKTA